MKSVLIIVNEFKIGGTISSLNSLLSIIDNKKIKVDIFSRLRKGPYYESLPNCSILKENVWLSHTVYEQSYFVKKAALLLLCVRKLFEHLGVNLYPLYNYIGGKLIHSWDYDAVIGFDETLVNFVSYLPAKKRINWIHCDYRRFANGKDESKFYDRIDTVVCVSEFVRGVFCDIYPQYRHKTVAIHNVINENDIVRKSKLPIDDNRFFTDDFTIVSCGRLDPVKQFTKIPKIAAELKAKVSKPFRWYIIGGGNDKEEKKIKTEIALTRTIQNVITLGMKSNVYPYLKKADLYVCTSASESFPMVVNEAKVLSVPVITNNFPSAIESIRDGIDGFICSMDEMPDYIIRQMNNPLMIRNNNYKNDNETILEKIISIL